MSLNLVKLCVGVSEIAELEMWARRRAAEATARGEEPTHTHVTRQRPRRAAEILDGGSLYWVIGGVIQVRQRILGLDEVTGSDAIRRCAIRLEPRLVPTEWAPRRAFQGWRYLEAKDAPRDLAATGGGDIPAELRRELAELGLL